MEYPKEIILNMSVSLRNLAVELNSFPSTVPFPSLNIFINKDARD